MKKFRLKILSFVVALCMTILPLGSVWGASPQSTYVALGDSISTGYLLSNVDKECFTNQIAQYSGKTLINLSKNGMKTSDMLAILNSKGSQGTEYKNTIKSADLITISMGGNNVLAPLMTIIKTSLGLSSDATTEQVQAAIKNDPEASSKIYLELQKPQTLELLNKELQTFTTEYPQIIQKIKELNSDATIMVQTLYNPFFGASQYKPLADMAEPFIQLINQVITQSQNSSCKVIDTYTAFKTDTSGQLLTNISKFDIHPNAAGHTVIFNAHKVALDSMKPSNNVSLQVLAGDSRYTTAIKVSQERFKDGGAKSIILVGKDAVVDGLAAAPLAVQEQSPILFTDTNALSVDTIKEIKRVLGNNISSKTVYLIGGEGRISKSVEAQLNKEGIKLIDRIAGSNRYETSIKIAKKLNTNYEQAFVVGGNGEADAMSISAKAAELKAPIVVVDKQNLDVEAKELLANKQIDIIGGVESVSEKVKLELQAIDLDKNINRVAGTDRKSTNGMVIAKYYKTGTVTEIFVSKDGFVGGKDKLVDALAAAPLAGSKGSPIILTTGEISKEQQQSIISNLKGVTKLTQVGNGINEKTIQLISELIN